MKKRVPKSFFRPKTKSVRKPRYVDGHEAVVLDADGWSKRRTELLERAKFRCECGCGQPLSLEFHAHHWKGKTRGNKCDCAFHLEALTPACHREAHCYRLGQPFRRDSAKK